jgi:hypothetical protein
MSGKTITSRLIVSLLDGVSGPAGKASAALTALQKKASGTFGSAAAFAGVRRLGGAMGEFKTALYGPAGLMAGFAAVEQTHHFTKFTEHMNRIRAATMAGAEDMKTLKEEIYKTSKAHARSYDEVAEGALQLVKSGKTIHEVIGALDATVGASLAIEKSVGHTAETLTDIIYGMGLRVTNQQEATQVFAETADVAVAASFKFNQSYDEMTRALAKGAPMARVMGLSLRDIATFAGISADENFKGAKAGASMASSWMRLTSQTKKARAELASAGIDLSEFFHRTKDIQNLGGKTLADVLQEEVGIDAEALVPKFDAILKDQRFKGNATRLGSELQAAIAEGLSMDANSPNIEKAREAVDIFIRGSMSKVDLIGIYRELAAKGADQNTPLMKELFGLHHAPSQIAVVNAFRQGLFDSQSKALAEAAPGAVARHGEENLKGLSGALMKITSAWKLFGAAILDTGGAADGLVTILNRATTAINALAGANPAALKVLGGLGIALASFAALAVAADVLKIALAGVRLAFVALTSPIGLVVAGLGALAYFNWEAIKAGWTDFSSGFSKGFWDNLKIPDSVGQSWENLKRQFEAVSGLKLDLPSWRELGELLGGTVAAGVNLLASAFEHVCNWISQAIGLAKQAADALGNIKMPSLFGGGAGAAPIAGARAAGGPVVGGHPYLIGEKGPELFVPGSSGSVTPNHKLGGGGSVHLAPVFNFHGVNTSDPRELARTMRREWDNFVNETFRGAQADVGLRWS